MTGAFVSKQCKKACDLCRKKPGRQSRQSALSRPLGSSCIDPGPPKRKCPDKRIYIYVAADPADQTCIVVGRPPGRSSCSSGGGSDGGGSGGGGGTGGISFRFPVSTSKLMVYMPDLSKTNGGQNSECKDANCIQIKGHNIVRTGNGGVQIVPCNAKAGGGGGGGVQISVARSGGSGCGSGGGSGNIQLSFGKGKGNQPSITCEPGSQELEISYGPEKRKLNLNHSKHTVASMINKRITELEIEKKLADRSKSDIHERR